MKNQITSVIKLFLVILLLTFYTKPLISEYGLRKSIHVTFLAWSFLVLCLPIAKGNILINKPYEFFFGGKIHFPEIITWSVATIGNLLTYLISFGTYFKASIPHLLLNIISTPWPYWIIILTCFIATFYSAVIRNSPKKKSPKYKILGILLNTTSIIVTIFLAYDDYILVLNSHGNS